LHLRSAVARLDSHPDIVVVAQSSVYETEAMDDAVGQSDFYNAVVQVDTALGPRELLRICKDIERTLGREPGGPRHAPRPIDIDLLLLDDMRLDDADLTIPHPGLAHRAFVQIPLLELDPTLPVSRSEGQRVTPVGSLQPE
jgi:2-amino-4-hydroxy-6-hydroxymethyldihydropteridine diphosphokinase